jgi:hypothetical protein
MRLFYIKYPHFQSVAASQAEHGKSKKNQTVSGKSLKKAAVKIIQKNQTLSGKSGKNQTVSGF